jgi:hypothetical protein
MVTPESFTSSVQRTFKMASEPLDTGPLSEKNVEHQFCSDWLKDEIKKLFKERAELTEELRRANQREKWGAEAGQAECERWHEHVNRDKNTLLEHLEELLLHPKATLCSLLACTRAREAINKIRRVSD